jgi:hypothetical protein
MEQCMISSTILAAAAKVAEHSARRSTPLGVSEAPLLAQRVLEVPVVDCQDPAGAAHSLPLLGRKPPDSPAR